MTGVISCRAIFLHNLALRELIGQLSILIVCRRWSWRLAIRVDGMVLVEPLNEADEQLLRNYADQRTVRVLVCNQRPDTAYAFYPLDAPALTYSLPEFR